jgi:hypothetical protein
MPLNGKRYRAGTTLRMPVTPLRLILSFMNERVDLLYYLA